MMMIVDQNVIYNILAHISKIVFFFIFSCLSLSKANKKEMIYFTQSENLQHFKSYKFRLVQWLLKPPVSFSLALVLSFCFFLFQTSLKMLWESSAKRISGRWAPTPRAGPVTRHLPWLSRSKWVGEHDLGPPPFFYIVYVVLPDLVKILLLGFALFIVLLARS